MARGIRKIIFHPESPGPLVPVGSLGTGLPDSVRGSDNPDTTAVGRILTAEEKDRITMALRRIRFGQPPKQPGNPHPTPEAGSSCGSEGITSRSPSLGELTPAPG